PAGRLKHPARAWRKIGKIGLPHRFRRKVRMDVDWHVELHGRRQETVVARVIKKVAFRRAVDERSQETKFLDGADEFGSGGIRGLHRQRGEARKARRMAGDGRRQMVVDFAAHRDAIWAGNKVRAGTSA